MTMQQEMPPPEFGAVWAALTQKQREQVLKEAADEIADIFGVMYKEMQEQAGFATPRPDVRLQMYRMRAQQNPIAWAVLRAVDPKEYARQMDDWHDLEEKQANMTPRRPTAQPVNGPRMAYAA